MASISSNLNSVSIHFKDGVNNDVDEKLNSALRQVVRYNFPGKHIITSLTVSSLSDSHEGKPKSRHNQKKAIDISKINGKSIQTYNNDPEIRNLVEFIQTEFEKVPGRRENFGPYMKHKSGKPYSVGGHHDHIHLSVD